MSNRQAVSNAVVACGFEVPAALMFLLSNAAPVLHGWSAF